MARRKYARGKYKKPSKRSAATQERKARSMQTSWRHATNRTETLTIDAAKAIIEAPPDCPYCLKPIHWRELSIDHMQPRSRDGASAAENLTWCHKECNLVKGNLNNTEFKLLLAFLDQHPSIKENVLPRLKAGGIIFRRRGRRR